MLDLVKSEIGRIESRFLETACGNGNFLSVILERKLLVVQNRYGALQFDFERYAMLAVSSIYGIDILADNVHECRQRLFFVLNEVYTGLFKNNTQPEYLASIRLILDCNIIWGDALSLKTVGEPPEYIVFAEWSLVNGSLLKRRDFTFHGLLDHDGTWFVSENQWLDGA